MLEENKANQTTLTSQGKKLTLVSTITAMARDPREWHGCQSRTCNALEKRMVYSSSRSEPASSSSATMQQSKVHERKVPTSHSLKQNTLQVNEWHSTDERMPQMRTCTS